MDLRSDYPYSLLRRGIIHSYPSLQENAHTDIVIMGGGISGALAAWQLINAGFNIILVDRRHIGMGSTAASTSLLQYEIDVPMHELANRIGIEKAARSYHLCREAIEHMAAISRQLRLGHFFRKKPSFQFASYNKDVRGLKKEFRLRKENGFRVQWMEENEITKHYGFSRPGGILSEDGGEADAYAFTHAVLKNCIAKGLQVYDHTKITTITHHKRSIELMTDTHKKIKARKLIIACGYESQQYISKRVQDLHSTYVIISEPHEQKEFWYKNSLIWETHHPYLYLRTTADNRILVGGKDISSSYPARRDRLLPAKARSLETSFHKLFPSIPFRADFKWAGSFASTKDGLPYIGCIPERPHTYFALGFGGNGITFSMIAARLITDMLRSKKNTDISLFAFNR